MIPEDLGGAFGMGAIGGLLEGLGFIRDGVLRLGFRVQELGWRTTKTNKASNGEEDGT